MKNINKFLVGSFCAMAAVSCQDLDTEYLGGYVTTDQKENTLEKNPDMAFAGVTAIFSNYNQYALVYSSHYDFGYPAIMMGLDLQGMDMAAKNSGYNWMAYWEGFTACNPNGVPTSMMWYHIYKNLKVVNDLLATISPETENDDLKYYRAQGLAMRAFGYFNLAQTYQFTYVGNETKPCVPIITDVNSAECAANGAPRATVQEVYDQILTDLNDAIALLGSTPVTAEDVIDSKPKRMVSLAVAYGLRARVNLVMNKWAEAAEDAKNAIQNFDGRPYTMTEVSSPSFNTLDDAAWMWGFAIAETDRVVTTGICNFPSFMGSFNSSGYITYGAWKWCSKSLYESIPTRDVRKGWFLDEDYLSNNIPTQWQAYLDNYVNADKLTYEQDNSNYIMPYTQVKFAPYNDVLGQTTNACDIPLMRVEEMYYIYAEATAMGGNAAAAKSFLEDFVKTYRNPGYSTTASTAAELQDEIWHERRMEFWGEGLSYFDIMRLKKDINRVGAAFPSAWTYNIPYGSAAMIYCIPNAEIQTNKQISESDNNPSASKPTPVI